MHFAVYAISKLVACNLRLATLLTRFEALRVHIQRVDNFIFGPHSVVPIYGCVPADVCVYVCVFLQLSKTWIVLCVSHSIATSWHFLLKRAGRCCQSFHNPFNGYTAFNTRNFWLVLLCLSDFHYLFLSKPNKLAQLGDARIHSPLLSSSLYIKLIVLADLMIADQRTAEMVRARKL